MCETSILLLILSGVGKATRWEPETVLTSMIFTKFMQQCEVGRI